MLPEAVTLSVTFVNLATVSALLHLLVVGVLEIDTVDKLAIETVLISIWLELTVPTIHPPVPKVKSQVMMSPSITPALVYVELFDPTFKPFNIH